jgi:hypothetical protein
MDEGWLRIDPSSVRAPETVQNEGIFEVVVPYTDLEITPRVVEKAATLAKGLNATLELVAVYVAPYPADLRCPSSVEAHLISRLTEIAEKTTLPSSVHLVVARDRDAGFSQALRPVSAILLGSPRRLWRTREERLARKLARAGHHVSLLHFD